MRKISISILLLILGITFTNAQISKLTTGEVAKLETKLRTKPADYETRKKLIDYYLSINTATSKNALQQHRLQLVKYHAENAQAEIMGLPMSEESRKTPAYKALKDEWLKQVATNKTNEIIRDNAVIFFNLEPEIAEKLLLEGLEIDSNNHNFIGKLIQIYQQKIEALTDSTESETSIAAKKKTYFEKILKVAKKTAEERVDGLEWVFLQITSWCYLELGDLKNAKKTAESLLKETENPANISDILSYENYLIAQSILGRVALREGNIAKANEHLLNTVKFPNFQKIKFPKIELGFLEEFFEKAEAKQLLEYLQRSESLAWDSEQKETIKMWQSQISEGQKPAFNLFLARVNF